MKNMNKNIALALMISTGATFLGCGGGGSGDTDINIDTLHFTSPKNISLNPGQSIAIDVDATDPDGKEITYALSGTDADKFSIDPKTGVVSFKKEASSGVSRIKVTATAGGRSVSQNITITVITPINSAPSITSKNTVSVNENQKSAIDIEATDKDGDPLTFSITGGADAESFLIDPPSGKVIFKEIPVFEKKQTYSFTVSVTDGIDTTSEIITININDVTDSKAPVISNAPIVTVDENQRFAVDIDAADVDNEKITYSITGGTDAGSFSIDQDSGVVTFNTAPDYESQKNSYTLTVGAANSYGMTQKNITISINDLEGKSLVFTTGQKTKYATGDDGDLQIGRLRSISASGRYIKDQIDSRMLTENNTKVTWKNNDFIEAKSYTDALRYCNAIKYNGHDDWRLPTIEELTDLADRGESNYFGSFNILKPDKYYWSKTPYKRDSGKYYTFGFDLGEDDIASTDEIRYVACVRKESDTDNDPFAARFTRVDDIVTDSKTKLQWYDPSPATDVTKGDWNQAIADCNNLNVDGGEWRLPNINELLTIVDRSKSGGDAFYDIFETKEAFTYYSSTTTDKNGSKAWGVNFIRGTDVASITKTRQRDYRCVRTLGE